MNMNLYLQGDDLSAYGTPSAGRAQVRAASVLIDSFLQRPEGLLYTADAAGNPCFMAGMAPVASFSCVAPINPGSNVVVTLNGPLALLEVGKVLILDRANAQLVEPVLVTAVSGNQVTLASVALTHAAGAQLDAGLVIQEEKFMPEGRPLTAVSRAPVLRLLAGQGRYGYGRRGRVNAFAMDDFNLLATMTHFGGPPQWEGFDVAHAGFEPHTGKVWIPSGVLLAYFSEVRLQYVAGYTYATLPAAVKQACANIINAAANFPMLNGNIQQLTSGDTQVKRFADTVLDADTKAMLGPYVARAFA
jgi:hypothetical protein